MQGVNWWIQKFDAICESGENNDQYALSTQFTEIIPVYSADRAYDHGTSIFLFRAWLHARKVIQNKIKTSVWCEINGLETVIGRTALCIAIHSLYKRHPACVVGKPITRLLSDSVQSLMLWLWTKHNQRTQSTTYVNLANTAEHLIAYQISRGHQKECKKTCKAQVNDRSVYLFKTLESSSSVESKTTLSADISSSQDSHKELNRICRIQYVRLNRYAVLNNQEGSSYPRVVAYCRATEVIPRVPFLVRSRWITKRGAISSRVSQWRRLLQPHDKAATYLPKNPLSLIRAASDGRKRMTKHLNYTLNALIRYLQQPLGVMPLLELIELSIACLPPPTPAVSEFQAVVHEIQSRTHASELTIVKTAKVARSAENVFQLTLLKNTTPSMMYKGIEQGQDTILFEYPTIRTNWDLLLFNKQCVQFFDANAEKYLYDYALTEIFGIINTNAQQETLSRSFDF